MRKHYTSYLKHCTLLIVAAASMASCGLLDYDLEGNPERVAVTMHLDRDTMYVMTGDHFMLIPIFDPDTVNIEDLFYYTDDYDWGLDGSDYSDELEEGQRGNAIVVITPSTMIAQSPGWTTVYVQSVSARLRDSCAVCVLEPWEYVIDDYLHETVIYAQITVNGETPSEDSEFAAFVGPEMRAFGEYTTGRGTAFYVFRVGHDLPLHNQPEGRIGIYYYDAEAHHLFSSSSLWLYTEGESHGTPSNPILIDLK